MEVLDESFEHLKMLDLEISRTNEEAEVKLTDELLVMKKEVSIIQIFLLLDYSLFLTVFL